MVGTKATHIVKIRVTETQYLRLLNMKESEGFCTLSNFIRQTLLKEDYSLILKVNAIYNYIMQLKEEGQKKNEKISKKNDKSIK